MAVPTWIPTGSPDVEKMLGSGEPSGAVLPVLRLSPFKLAHMGGAGGPEPGGRGVEPGIFTTNRGPTRFLSLALEGLIMTGTRFIRPGRPAGRKVASTHHVHHHRAASRRDGAPAKTTTHPSRVVCGRSGHRGRSALGPPAGGHASSCGRHRTGPVPRPPPCRRSRCRAGCRGSRGSASPPASPDLHGRVPLPVPGTAAASSFSARQPVSALVRKTPARSVPSSPPAARRGPAA